MTDSVNNPSAPSWAEHLGYNALNAASGFREKLNKPPGLHLLFCAVAATVCGGLGLRAMDFLTGKDRSRREDMPGHEVPGDLKGSLWYDRHMIMPSWDELKEMPEDKRKEYMRNEAFATMHRFVPAILGGIGVLFGSKYYFEHQGRFKKEYKNLDSLSNENTFDAQRKIGLMIGEALGPLSAILMSTGGGSLRAFSGHVMTSRFIQMQGDINALPGMGDVMHGHHVSWKFNYAANKLMDDILIPYLANTPKDEMSWDSLRDAAGEMLRQLYGNKADTPERVEEMAKLMVEIREHLVKELNLGEGRIEFDDQKDLRVELKKVLHNHWEWFLEESTDLDPRKADILGKGLIPTVGMGLLTLFGGADKVKAVMEEFKQAAPALAPDGHMANFVR